MDAATWVSSYDSAEKRLTEALSEFKGGKRMNPREKKKLGATVSKIGDDIKALHSGLEELAKGNKIGEGEVGRRRAMLSSLESQFRDVNDVMSGAKRREELVDQARRTEETEETLAQSNHELLQAQAATTDRQEAALDSVLSGVVRVGQLSKDIGGELDLQAPLLEDLHGAVVATDGRMVRNIQRVEEIEEKESGGWGLLCCIVLLVVVIVFFAASNLPCHIFAPSRC